ncbi:MAG: hypothetical protein JWN66_1029 [Sphingomonas bacterium]|uniref:hypothetical protein n=1 Tax=Sphingomonas bacterium TaxID=1895847 RepID=UPI00261F9145|nr:hypothetical protein [Sphingomonas bacterium]MDB5703913.1 hypothetical protein [Sphingomonas bacterium]
MVAAALIVAVGIVRHGLAFILIDQAPVLAAAIDGGNARAAVAAARAIADTGPRADSGAIDRLVGAALKRDVTIPAAIELRALAAAGSGDGERADRLFHLSSTISRRSLPTRMWLIQQAVDRDDVAGALDNFDIALRTSADAPPRLFPILAGAAGDPVLVPAIARVLDRQPQWGPEFVFFAIKQGHAADVANVVLGMRGRASLATDSLDQTLVGQLVAERRFDAARRVYTAFAGRGPTGSLADPRFDDPSARFPFGWTFTDGADMSAARGAGGGGSGLSYRAGPGSAGTVASQLLMLPAGPYRLTTATAEDAPGGGARPYWTVTCAEVGGSQLVLLDQPAAGNTAGAATLLVPKGCPAQWLALGLRASAEPGGQSGGIASVKIEATPRPVDR